MENQEYAKFRSPADYLKIFFRRKWLFLAPIVVGLVLAVVAGLLLPPLYESSTTIIVEEEKIINPLIQNLAVSTTAAQRMASIKENLLGWNSLVKLTEKLNLASGVHNQVEFERLIEGLRRSITVEMKQFNIIKISYASGTPEQTQLVTKTLTDILIEKNKTSQTKETDVAINFIQEQLSIYKRKIKESEIAGLEDQLKVLLIDSTEQHPMVRELRQKISVARNELASGEYQVAVSDQPINDTRKEALRKEIDTLIEKETQSILRGGSQPAAGSAETANNALYRILLMEKMGGSSSGAKDITVNEAIYNMLLQRLETAKITQRLEVSKEGTRYSIIEPARLPLRPTRPNKLQLILLGLIAGGCAGAGLVFAREFFDHSFLDIEDAKHDLTLPVLGAIPCITTQEEIDREKTRNTSLISLFAIFSVLIIIVSYVISLLRK